MQVSDRQLAEQRRANTKLEGRVGNACSQHSTPRITYVCVYADKGIGEGEPGSASGGQDAAVRLYECIAHQMHMRAHFQH